MKIALLGNLPRPLDNSLYRGIESFNSSLADELTSLGHDVTVYTSTPTNSSCELKNLIDPSCLGKLKELYDKGKTNSQDFAKIARHSYLSVIKEIESLEFDLIHNNSLETLPLLASSTINTPMLTGLHHPPTSKQKYLLEYQTYRPKSFFCASSNIIRDVWKQSFPDLDVAMIEAGTLKLKNTVELNLSESVKSGIWLGSIKEDCGLKEVLEGCNLAGVDIKVFGEIESESYFTNEIGPFLNKSVRYFGHMDMETIKKHMFNSRFAVAGADLKRSWILEMLANGLPIIGKNTPELKELINDTNGRLYPKNVPGLVARSIESISSLCRVKIQQNAIKDWNTTTMANKYEKVYKFLKAIHDRDKKEKAYWYLYTSSKQRSLV